jgi:GGDEF domain-containing protein
MPRHVRTVAFIDLDKIHTLNQEYGYSEVDKRVKATFSITFRRSDVVARWFSGDEIVILFDSDRIGAERKMEELAESAGKQGLTFKYEIGTWEVGIETIETVVERLTEKLALQKSGSGR